MKRVTTLALSILIIGISGYIALKKHDEQADFDRKLPDSAIFNEQIPQSPEGESLYCLLAAEIALSRDEPEIAIANYIKVAQLSEDPEVAERATRIALNYGSESEALIPALLWSKNSPENTEAQLVSAGLMILTEQSESALPYLERVLVLNPEEADRDIVSLYKQFNTTDLQENYIQVIEALEKKSQSTNVKLLLPLALADMYLNQKQSQAAYEKTQLLITTSKQPLPERAYILHTQALYQLDKIKEATSFLKHHIAQLPKHILARMYYIELLLQQQNALLAKQELQQLSKLPDVPTNYLLQLARLSMEVQWYEEATLFFMRIKDDAKDGNVAKYFLARLADMQNHKDEALTWYKQVDSGSFHMNAFIRAGSLLIDEKKYNEALALLDNANPESVDDYKRLVLAQSDIYTRLGNFHDGFELLTKSLVDLPQDVDFLYARALMSTHLNNLTMAEKDLSNILNTQPNHVDALNALGFILTNDNNRLDEAYTLLSKAITLAPTNPSVMDSLGWLYYKKGNHVESLKWLKEAIKIQPDADISAHLGEVLWQSGQKEAAKQVWAAALKNHPNDLVLQQTVQKTGATLLPATTPNTTVNTTIHLNKNR